MLCRYPVKRGSRAFARSRIWKHSARWRPNELQANSHIDRDSLEHAVMQARLDWYVHFYCSCLQVLSWVVNHLLLTLSRMWSTATRIVVLVTFWLKCDSQACKTCKNLQQMLASTRTRSTKWKTIQPKRAQSNECLKNQTNCRRNREKIHFFSNMIDNF